MTTRASRNSTSPLVAQTRREEFLNYTKMAAQTYKDISAIARQRRHDALAGEAKLSASQLRDLPKDVTHISRDLKVFSQDEIEIINSEPEDILLKISERIWTALEVTEAFCKSAAIAQQLVCQLASISNLRSRLVKMLY